MEPIIWVALGGLALVAIVATLVALNRSWGNFPKDARYEPPSGSSAPGMSSPAGQPGPAMGWNAPASDDGHEPNLPDPESWLVPVNHPLVRRAAEQALQRGDTSARYIVRQGEQLYFDFAQISDPLQRRRAYAAMRRFADGQDVDLKAMLQTIQQLFKA